jgi:hypothetical protein
MMTSWLSLRDRRAYCWAYLAILASASASGFALPRVASAASVRGVTIPANGVAYSTTPLANEPWTPCAPAKAAGAQCELIKDPQPSILTGVQPYEGDGRETGGLTPEELRQAYKLPETGGKESTIAIIDPYNDPSANADLKVYRKEYGLPECSEEKKCFTKVNSNGEAGSYPMNERYWSEEISLDLDMVSAACGECHILLVEASSESHAAMGAAEEEAVKLKASAISNSWNWGFETGNSANKNVNCETERCVSPEEETSLDHYFDHPGTPILFSGGDYGYAVRYPAVSQYVIAVGGTTLKKEKEPKTERKWTETVWSNPEISDDKDGRGGGSGCSTHEPKPRWQTGTAYKACAGRIETDVAADADWVNSPVSTYDSYESPGWQANGGTSASAPFVAGIEGLDSGFVRSIGAEAFYKHPSSLFDVTEGNNGPCTPPEEDAFFCVAASGYDGPSGWGAPDGAMGFVSFSPSAVTEAASKASETGATLNGAVNPEDLASEYYFEYGPSISYGTSVPLTPAKLEAGTSYKEVSQAITGLTASTTYHFRIVAVNGDGTTDGLDQTFSTTGRPSVETKAATGVGKTEATLNSSVNPRGEEAKYYFEYGLTTAYGTKTGEVSAGSGSGNLEEALAISGLLPNATYHFRAVASNASGATDGGDATLTTLAAAPVVWTGTATGATETAATLNGTVNPNGAETKYWFEYGTTKAYGSKTAEVSAGAGRSSLEESKALAGLSPSATYYYRIAATNAGGTSYGLGKTLSTTGKPSVETGAASGVGALEATVNGLVNPRGAETKYYFEYGSSKTYGSKTAEVSAGAGTSSVEASRTIVGLEPEKTYHYRLVASNGIGTTDGEDKTLTTEEAPEFNVEPGSFKGTFGRIGMLALESFSFASGTISGEMGKHTGKDITITFSEGPRACDNEGSSLTLKDLNGRLGYIDKKTEQVGLMFEPVKEPDAECDGYYGSSTYTGVVIARLSEITERKYRLTFSYECSPRCNQNPLLFEAEKETSKTERLEVWEERASIEATAEIEFERSTKLIHT